MLFPSGLMRSLYFNPRGPCGPRLHRRRNPPGRDISILAVLADRDDNPALRRTINQLFQSSRSLRTATLPLYAIDNNGNISILAVLADRDKPATKNLTLINIFQSSRSLRTATTSWDFPGIKVKLFQSSRSLRTATVGGDASDLGVFISILAVLADRDAKPRFPVSQTKNISILAVLADRDERAFGGLRPQVIFQSSRSLRTATKIFSRKPPIAAKFQSSRSLRTATVEAVSIVLISRLFQSSRSLRTATTPPNQ